MKISEMIEKLQQLQKEHGDLNLYEYNDWATISEYKGEIFPRVNKIYYQKWEDAEHMIDELRGESLGVVDGELYDVDLTKPIVIGVII